ncbi:Uncharacterized conserved protein [Geodermatophilus africanus]|uniref:Uncharacterized conserved protein n=1 Tax=Geodermatophilus africanus TaxID=1137993 RepID=A0A1H3I9U5_9ACTN|nr:YciI family protein [Geodermatophilus africanus]SDY24503.1 Uncharacterized conserved protein [Geodermatophilus africanus]
MAQYLLNLVQPVGDPPPPEVLEPIMRDVQAVSEEMRAAGAWVFAAALHAPEASTVLKPQGDEVLVVDGPYVEAKEFVGGFTVVEADDLDAALEWGRRYARATGLPIEVRPVADRGV